MNIIFTMFLSFLSSFIIILLFKKLLNSPESTTKILPSVLDLSIIGWSSSLLIYTAFFNRSIAAISTSGHALYYFINLFMAIVLVLVISYASTDQYLEQLMFVRNKKSTMTKPAGILLGFYAIVLFISLLLYTSSSWLISTFGPVSIDQLLYSMGTLGGTNTDQVITFVDKPIVISAVITYLFVRGAIFLAHYSLASSTGRRRRLKKKSVWRKVLIPVSMFSIFAGSSLLSINNIGFAQVRLFFGKSTLFESEYVDPKTVDIEFPEQKRNLIYIFVESLEGSYASRDLGGTQDYNLLEDLTNFIDTDGAINFSDSDKIGGAYQVPGAEYTAAAIVAQTSGTPLKAPTTDANSFGWNDSYSDGSSAFLPGVTSIAEILQNQGYNQTFLLGSDATFGGRRTYFEQHGGYDILDLVEVKNRGMLPQDYYTWWGFEDQKLFEYAKDEATNLYNQGEPFNLTMLTADTHFPDGLLTADQPTPYDNQYANVISYSSYQVAEFIKWCMQQPFYENTTIVVSGDHLTMDQNFVESFPDDYERTVFNLFINSPIVPEDEDTKNRTFTTMDMFPTTLASLNVNVKGNKLGLGTNLFSGDDTLVETFPIETVRDGLTQQSDFYTKYILNYDETKYTNSREGTAPTSSSTTAESTTATTGTTVPAPTTETVPATSETTTESINDAIVEGVVTTDPFAE